MDIHAGQDDSTPCWIWGKERHSTKSSKETIYSLCVNTHSNSGDISTNPGPRCLCKLCKRGAEDRGIQCDVCNKWLHPDCVFLGETEYLRLGESDEIWLCPDCNEKDDLKKDFYSTLQAEINFRGLKVAHINCRGLFGKLTEITLVLQETKIDILGITETHLSDKIRDEEIRIDGYNVERLDRSNQQGGVA